MVPTARADHVVSTLHSTLLPSDIIVVGGGGGGYNGIVVMEEGVHAAEHSTQPPCVWFAL